RATAPAASRPSASSGTAARSALLRCRRPTGATARSTSGASGAPGEVFTTKTPRHQVGFRREAPLGNLGALVSWWLNPLRLVALRQLAREAHDAVTGIGEARVGRGERDAQVPDGAGAEAVAGQHRHPLALE